MSVWQKRTTAELRQQLTSMGHRVLPTNRDGFDDEFDSLRAVDHKVRCNRDEFYTGSLGSNMSKNRFRDVLPNEGTRVTLDSINARGDGDYINANYIDGRRLFGVPFVYIATQAPMQGTVADFWRMVYENNTAYIVMLCAEIESGKVKSERYWPDSVGEVMPVGSMNVVLVNENHRNDTVYRTIALRTLEGRERTVHHLQYIRWPDQGIPNNSAGLIDVIYTLGRSPMSTQTPIVVHCSGGAGRTGCFIGLHVALALFQLEQPVSIPRIVQYLKYCRTGMVQRKDQYLFLYYAALREMEKMIWSAETFKHTTDGRHLPNQRREIDNFSDVERRGIEYAAPHPAQSAPDFGLKSKVAHTYDQLNLSHAKDLPQQGPDHSIRALADIVDPSIINRGSSGTHEPSAPIDELALLRRRNQMQRSTPARLSETGENYRSTSTSQGYADIYSSAERAAQVEPLASGGFGGSGRDSYHQPSAPASAVVPPVAATTTTTTTYSPPRSQLAPVTSNPLEQGYGGGSSTVAAASALKTAPELTFSPTPQPPVAQAAPTSTGSATLQPSAAPTSDWSPIASSHPVGSPGADGPRTAASDWLGSTSSGPQQQQVTRTTTTTSSSSVRPTGSMGSAAAAGVSRADSDLAGAADAFHSDVFGPRVDSTRTMGTAGGIGGGDAVGFTSHGQQRRADFGLL